jgi:cold shock CspA family protein
MRRSRLLGLLQPSRVLWCPTVLSTVSPLSPGAAEVPASVASPATPLAGNTASAADSPPVRRLDKPDPEEGEDEVMPMPEKGQLMTGKCTNWHSGKGFGFITGDYDQRQYFVHFQALFVKPGGYHSLINGQQVRFTVDIVPHSVTKQPQLKALQVTAPDGKPLPAGPRPDGGSGLVARAPNFVKEHMEKEGVKEVEEDGGKRSLFFTKSHSDERQERPFRPNSSDGRRPIRDDRRNTAFARGRGSFAHRGRGGQHGGREQQRGGGSAKEAGLSFASFSSGGKPAEEDNSFLGDVPTLEGFEQPAAERQGRGFSGRGGGFRGRGGGAFRGRGDGAFRGRGDGFFRGRGDGAFRGRGDGAFGTARAQNRDGPAASGAASAKLFSAVSTSAAPEENRSRLSSPQPIPQPQPQFDEL